MHDEVQLKLKSLDCDQSTAAGSRNLLPSAELRRVCVNKARPFALHSIARVAKAWVLPSLAVGEGDSSDDVSSNSKTF